MRLSLSDIPVDVKLVVASDPGDDGLPPEERHACSTLPPHRRSDWRAGRMAARGAAASGLGLDDQEPIVIDSAPGRAPQIRLRARLPDDPPRNPLPLALSLAHRDGYAAAAVSRGANRIGVDLEAAGAVPCSYARYFLTQRERDITCLRDPTEIWVLKEAAWKALGCDETVPFTALELQFDNQGAVTGVCLQGRTWPARAVISAPWPDYLVGVFWSPLPLRPLPAAEFLARLIRGGRPVPVASHAPQQSASLHRQATPRP